MTQWITRSGQLKLFWISPSSLTVKGGVVDGVWCEVGDLGGFLAAIFGVLESDIGFTPYLWGRLAFYNSIDIYQFKKRLLRIFLAK